MIVLDANILIALLDPHDAHHQRVDAFLRERLDSVLLVNALTLAEALVRPVREGRGGQADAAFAELGITCVDVSRSDVLAIAEWRHHTRLRMPDAVVIYTAVRERAAIATTDTAVARAARARSVTVHEV